MPASVGLLSYLCQKSPTHLAIADFKFGAKVTFTKLQ